MTVRVGRAAAVLGLGAAVDVAGVALSVGTAVVDVSVVGAGGVSGVVAGGVVVTVGAGWLAAGASCAASWVEESARTAAIAVAPARAYSFVVVLIMEQQPFRPVYVAGLSPCRRLRQTKRY